jgi:uncharacterized protein Smg (DUF494 family)
LAKFLICIYVQPGLERLLFKNLGFLGFLENLKILKNPKIRFLGFSNLIVID